MHQPARRESATTRNVLRTEIELSPECENALRILADTIITSFVPSRTAK
jgi:hypothetical protein